MTLSGPREETPLNRLNAVKTVAYTFRYLDFIWLFSVVQVPPFCLFSYADANGRQRRKADRNGYKKI